MRGRRPPATHQAAAEQRPWYYRTSGVVALLLLFWPAGLIVMWVGRRFSLGARIAITAPFALAALATSVRLAFQPVTSPPSPPKGAAPSAPQAASAAPSRKPKRPALISFKLAKNDDTATESVVKRVRALLVGKGHSEGEIETLLRWYHHDLWRETRGVSAQNKLIFVYVYDDNARIKAGLGEWIGMVKNGPGSLVEWPSPVLRVPDYRQAPTRRESRIYDHLMKKLFEQANLPEEQVKQRVARRFKISVAELEEIHLKVFTHRH